MKRSDPVIIGSLEFSSPKNAKAFYRAMRDKYADGVKIGDEDECLLRDLVAIHSEAEEKAGCGIAFFTVETDRQFRRTRHFQIHRTDGTHTDFSFPHAIDGPSMRRDRLNALREAIRPQIIVFRDECFSQGSDLSCPLTQAPLRPGSCHVDHMPPRTFQHLVKEWLIEFSIRFENIEITHPADNQYIAEMTDSSQKKSWVEFHQRYATLRLLSPHGNLSSAKGDVYGRHR